MISTRCNQPWKGMHIHVLRPLATVSRHGISMGVQGRGGVLVGPEGPVDIVVLPDGERSDSPASPRARQWVRDGAVVMWESAFLRAIGAPRGG